jgi:prepilin-type N-terminal cleavage/methylation domain-containing protein
MNTKGFTILEIAIVIVLIGIIIGIAVKAQEIVKNAKVKRLYSQEREIAQGIFSYYDKYTSYPGDDPNATAKFAGITNGNGNGLIATGIASTAPNFNCAATGSEQCDLWPELRQGNFLAGSGFPNPTSAFGYPVAVTYYTDPGWGGNALLTHWIVFQSVPYDVCQTLDRQYDDGSTAGAGSWQTGNIRGSGNYVGATAGNFNLYFRL